MADEIIIGQNQILEYIEETVRKDNPNGAYIINGDKGSGKKLLAKTFAMALNCVGDGIKPCRSCKSCISASNNTQPDIIWVTPKSKDIKIGINDIREQVISNINIKPVTSKYKVYIIPAADTLSVEAQNALLKTLEEPPRQVVIFLITNNYKFLLETIISRCAILRVRDITDSIINNYLVENLEIPKEKAMLCTAFARGNLGRAIKMAQSEYFVGLRDMAVSVLEKIYTMPGVEIVEAVKNMSDYSRLDIVDILDYMTIWYRDILLFKATNDTNTIIFKDKLVVIKERARDMSYEGIENVINALDLASERLNANVRFDLVMELLLMTMKEN